MPVDSTLERPLPNNLEAERSILGAILLDNNALNTAIEALKAEDFFLTQHRHVFQQMITLGEAQQAIDLVTLTEELHRVGELEAAGGAPYLASLIRGRPARSRNRRPHRLHTTERREPLIGVQVVIGVGRAVRH